MTLDRRDFLKTGLGLAAAAGTAGIPLGCPDCRARPEAADQTTDELERWIETSRHIRYLGRPRSLAAVRQGFWPIPPSRVLVLRPHPWASPANRWEHRQAQSSPRLRGELRRRGGLRDWRGRADEDRWRKLSDHKLGLIARITSALANYYAVPELRDKWAYSMAAREGLGSTQSASNIAQPEPFQFDPLGSRRIRTDNHDIDHWLILIPYGTQDWDGWNEHCDVHVMFTYVVADPEHSCPDLPILCLSQQAIFSLIQAEPWRHWARDPSPRIIELSRMSRAAAARLFGERLVAAARERDNDPQRM